MGNTDSDPDGYNKRRLLSVSKVHQKTKDIFSNALPYLKNGYKPSQIDKIFNLPKRSVSKAMKAMGCKWSEFHGGSTYKNKEWLE